MNAPDRQRALFDVGRKLILTQGYAATSVEEVCAGAGVTKGAFFHYFENKETFARELLADTWEPFRDAAEEARSQDGVAALHAHVDFMIRFATAEGRLVPNLAGELSQKYPDVGAQVRGYFAEWTELLRGLLVAASPVPGSFDIEEVVTFVIAAIEGAPVVVAQRGPDAATATAFHLKAYLESLIGT